MICARFLGRPTFAYPAKLAREISIAANPDQAPAACTQRKLLRMLGYRMNRTISRGNISQENENLRHQSGRRTA